MKKLGTVCFIVENGKVLLAQIQYPDGKKLWNGIGGVVDEGESPKETVCREVSEETNITINPENLVQEYSFETDGYLIHVFVATKWGGSLSIIDETIKDLRWYQYSEVPYSKMHKGNDSWLPGILHKY